MQYLMENSSSNAVHKQEDEFFEANPHLAAQRTLIADRNTTYTINILACNEAIFEIYQILRLFLEENRISRQLMVELIKEKGLNIAENAINIVHIHNGFLEGLEKLAPKKNSSLFTIEAESHGY